MSAEQLGLDFEAGEEEGDGLPPGWAPILLSEALAEGLMNGRSVRTAERGFPVLRLTALANGALDLREHKLGEWDRAAAEKYLVRKDDFLVSRGNGSIRLVGRGGLVPRDAEIAFPDTMIRVRARASLLRGPFLRYQWHAPGTRAQIEQAAKTTAGIFKVNQGDLESLRLLLPPLPEQKRIVAEIEKQFTRLDDAVATLERVKTKLDRARASVLKAAVEGRLVPTEAALAAAAGRAYEPAAALLERVLIEREKAHAAAQVGAKRKKTYKPPAAPETEGLPALPEGWAWATGDMLTEFVTSGSRGWAKYYADEGARFLRIGDLNRGTLRVDYVDAQRVSLPDSTEGKRSLLKPADLLVSITADVGIIGLVPAEIGEAYINQHVAVARCVLPTMAPYVGWFLTSQQGQGQFDQLRRGATKAGLGLGDIRSVCVALPPLAEQKRIVAEVERRLSVIEAAAAAVDANLKRCAHLRQSILKRAFEGRLVPQDPRDEPASALLERIRAARTEAAAP